MTIIHQNPSTYGFKAGDFIFYSQIQERTFTGQIIFNNCLLKFNRIGCVMTCFNKSTFTEGLVFLNSLSKWCTTNAVLLRNCFKTSFSLHIFINCPKLFFRTYLPVSRHKNMLLLEINSFYYFNCLPQGEHIREHNSECTFISFIYRKVYYAIQKGINAKIVLGFEKR